MQNPAANLLVIKLGALGDFIQGLGPCRAIRQHHPHARITLLTTKPFESLARASGYFDEVTIDARPRWHDFAGWMALRRALNHGHFERVYDLQNNDRTEIYFRLMNPRPEWVGAAKGASHRNDSPERTAGLAFDGHVQTLARAGVTGVEIDRLEWVEADLSRFALRPPYALIVPGSSPKRPDKRWPPARYAALCGKLAAKGLQPVLIGTAADSETTKEIAAACPAALDLTGKTSLMDIPALARGAALAVGNDTGPMHIIAPAGCPCLVLFSKASNPARHAPKGERLRTLQVDNLDDLETETVLAALETEGA